MKDFIEVTDVGTKCKVCLSTFSILAVFDSISGCAFIHTHTSKNDKFLGLNVIETYDEVITLLQDC